MHLFFLISDKIQPANGNNKVAIPGAVVRAEFAMTVEFHG
jgi:hypothetical protein